MNEVPLNKNDFTDESTIFSHEEDRVMMTQCDPFFIDDYDESVVNEALQQFGHQKFRPGQAEAVQRILLGFRSLLLQTQNKSSVCNFVVKYFLL